MPDLANGHEPSALFEYRIPPEIDAKITAQFYSALGDNLCRIFEDDVFRVEPDGLYEGWRPIDMLSGTSGYYKALEETCTVLGMKWLLDYWNSLEWYDSDIFDGIICDRMVERRNITQEANQ